MFLGLEAFKGKRKVVKDALLMLNIQFENIQELEEVKHDFRSVMLVEAGTYEKVNWQLSELFSTCS